MRLFFLLLASIVLAGCGGSGFDFEPANGPQSRFGDTKPVAFAGGSPHGFEIHGIDVARYQGDINWRTAGANGVSFAYIKATEGGDVFDVAF